MECVETARSFHYQPANVGLPGEGGATVEMLKETTTSSMLVVLFDAIIGLCNYCR